MKSLDTCGCHHHGGKTIIEAAGGITAAHRAVALRGIDAATGTGCAAANSVAHAHLFY